MLGSCAFVFKKIGKQELRRTDFASKLLAAEGEGGRGQVWVRGVSEVKQYPSGSG